MRIMINHTVHELDVAPDTPLLWVLRDTLRLKGTKYGCGVGICGICTVLAEGEPLRSCVVPVGEIADRNITTIEGLAESGHPLLTAWIEEQVPQCGYCQPGQIMSAAALLTAHRDPTDAEVDAAMAGVLCRCGTYQRIRRAIHAATSRPADAAGVPGPSTAAVDPGVALDEWIRIAPDGEVTLTINRTEMGQGATTALAMLLAEELEVDLSRVRTEFAPADPRYRNLMFDEQITGGSTSVRGEWERLSEAGARARTRLIKAAARRWGVKKRQCNAERGAVIHQPTGRRLDYGDLAVAAAAVKPPRRVKLKRPEQCRLLGQPVPRLEVPDMATGRTVYGMDVLLPGMRVACVLRCPVIGGILKTFHPDRALAVPGVERIFPISRGIAVVAKDTWSALRGREALTAEWESGEHADLDTARLLAQLNEALERKGRVLQQAGHPERALKKATRIVDADYATAPLAHAALEPVNCTARVTANVCEVWVGTQNQEGARATASRASGMPLAQVQVHSQYLGGGFGRRLESDMVEEAVETAKAAGCPVQVLWTRADDIQHDHYRPAYLARLCAALDADGWPLAWIQRSAGPNVTGVAWTELAYAIPNLHREFVKVDSPLPAGAWRSVGAGQDAFAVESFIDELAHAAARDPLAYRLRLLRDAPRQRAVLELAAKAAHWGEAAATGRHRGIAIYDSFGSCAAQVAEVSVTETAVRVHRVLCAIDCGRIVNPDNIRAQIEGGIALGLSAALKEAVSIERGGVIQSSFGDYPILTLDEMPEVEVKILESGEAAGGVGEPGLPPVAPAVANAVAAAKGIRLRSLPLRF